MWKCYMFPGPIWQLLALEAAGPPFLLLCSSLASPGLPPPIWVCSQPAETKQGGQQAPLSTNHVPWALVWAWSSV